MTEAEDLVEQAYACKDAGDLPGAERAYLAAIAASPNWAGPYYDLGLLYKYEGRWQESLRFNAHAALLDPGDEAAWWNLGIAATAVGDWSEARRAWTACGMKSPDGEGPPTFDFGMIPIRLDPDGEAEVVWAQRLDPARARVISVPLPTSRHNYGALLLTDGAADGARIVNGQEYPVLNMLAVLQPSPLRKFILEFASVDQAATDALIRVAEGHGGAAEDWGRTTHILCAKCSRGVPHKHPSEPNAPAHPHCGFAAEHASHAETIIAAWFAESPRADLVRWFDVDDATA